MSQNQLPLARKQVGKVIRRSAKKVIALSGIGSSRKGNKELAHLATRLSKQPFSSLETAQQFGEELGQKIVERSQKNEKDYLGVGIIRQLVLQREIPPIKRFLSKETQVEVTPEKVVPQKAAPEGAIPQGDRQPPKTSDRAISALPSIPSQSSTQPVDELKTEKISAIETEPVEESVLVDDSALVEEELGTDNVALLEDLDSIETENIESVEDVHFSETTALDASDAEDVQEGVEPEDIELEEDVIPVDEISEADEDPAITAERSPLSETSGAEEIPESLTSSLKSSS